MVALKNFFCFLVIGYSCLGIGLAGIVIDPNKILFLTYTRKNPAIPDVIRKRNDAELLNSHFNFSKPTKIFAHGWQGSPFEVSSLAIKDELLKAEDSNVILFDWSDVSGAEHDDLLEMGPELGGFLADYFEWMAVKGLEIESLHCIGFSFGNHLLGIAGRNLKTFRLPRITACDPPGFPNWIYYKGWEHSLTKEDTEYLEMIHTSMAALGQRYPVSHVDFYIDGGEFSPSCPELDIPCSHMKAVELYTESINTERPYIGVGCANLQEVVYDMCRGDTVIFGGLDKKRPGIYYVEVDGKNDLK